MTPGQERNISAFVSQNVFCCVSSLVSDVAKLVAGADRDTLGQTAFDEDELIALCSKDEWETPGIGHIHAMSRDDLIEALEDYDVEDERPPEDVLHAENIVMRDAIASGNPLDPDESIPFAGISDGELQSKLADAIEAEVGDWQDFCSKYSLDPETVEAYEHWAVDPWFGARLKERGEMVGDFGNLTVWGRTTSGQAISMDGVVQQIYEEHYS